MACCSARHLFTFISIYSVILSLILVGLSIWGLLTYYCFMNPAVSAFQMDNAYFTYALYFYNNECVDSDSDYIVWSPGASSRTWSWLIAYLTVNSCWLFASILFCWAETGSQGDRRTFWLSVPWLVTSLVVLGTDAVATVIYALDYLEMKTVDDLFAFAGITYPKKPASFDYIPLPSIIMVGVFSKAVIGWILLLFSVTAVLVNLLRSRKPKTLYLETREPDWYMPSALVNPAFEMSENRF